MNLPFLNQNKLPKFRKCGGVSKYGFSEDDELIESALDELLAAVDSRDHAGFIKAIEALVHCIKNKEVPKDVIDSF